MRCSSYCTASSYDLSRIHQVLKGRGTAQVYRDVVHLQEKKEKQVKGDIFFFSYGSVVFWGFTTEEEQEILKELKECERDSASKIEIDEFTFSYGQNMRIEEDQIILHNKNILTKLAVSHGIAQSVKLNSFEELMEKTIGHTRQLPIEMARRGKIGLSRMEISRKMGEIFIERSFINLHSEMLDTPEFFWGHPELEPFYRRTFHYLDIGKRIEILNKRLTVVHELMEILGNELRHQHSTRLELTIVILIVIEVVLAVMRDLLHWI